MIRRHFLSLHAVYPEDAVPYVPTVALHAREFARMFEAGIIKQTQHHDYYLDQFAFWHAREQLVRRAVPWVIAVSVLIAWLATRFYINTSGIN
jgi:hypothetical protein